MTKLRIFIGDDHAIVREGIKRLIDSASDMEVVGEAGESSALFTGVEATRPTTLVLDVSMPSLGAAETTRRLRKKMPKLQIVALTMHEEPGYLRELLEAGASGYVLKRAASEELLPALRAVAKGGTYVDPRMMTKLLSVIAPARSILKSEGKTTEREAEVLRHVAFGYTNREIGEALRVSVKSIETHRGRAMKKLGLRSRVDVVRYATEHGWLSETQP
jgi:two-component system response regulator NreC